MTGLDMVDFYEGRLECNDVGILQGWEDQHDFRISRKDLPKAVGTPSQMIAHLGLALHPFLLT